MRRRFLGPKHSKNGTSSSAHNKRLIPPSAVTSPVDHSSNRRSFVGGGSAAANTDESNCALMAENKYATIGRFAKKWPWECYRPSPPAAAPLPVDEKKCRLSQRGGEDGDSEALNGDGQRRRPRSMARAMEEAGDGIALLSITGAVLADHHHSPMSESSAHSPPEGAPPMAPGVLFQSTSVAGGNNRNSTGSTNSSQASSGFESAKSSSSHHLATSISSGSCSSGVGSSSATVVLPHSSVLPPNASPEGPASASSRLSSAGSSTQCRSSAYFSISDGFDSSIGPGGTLTVHKISKGKCPRVNITEMIARGIPEAEIFTEWLQRLCLSEYLALFLGQGYDLTTLARASPEDLTTLGITKPEDRKRLFHDIQTWRNLQDNWPKNLAFDANLSDWLNAIGLKQYVELFEQQGYLSVGSVEQLEPEDLEDIGVKKLGHIKRICLALKKLRSCRADSADMPLSVCPLLCPPSSSSSVCPLPSIVALPLDIHSTTFVPSSAAEDPFKQPTNKWQQSQMTQQSNSQPTTARNWDKNCQRISFDGISTDGTRIISKWREDNDKYVQLRNFSFERDSLDDQPTPDRGPPRLNLYRTSQIIAQLPREPPPEFDEADERGPTNSHLAEGHRGPPPPPAPAPFAPFEMLPLALPSSSCSVSSSSSFLRLFSSQPTTPRHAPHPTFPQVFMDDDHYYGGRQLRQRHFLNAAEGSFNVPTKERTEQPRGIMETELTNLVSKR